VAIHAKIQHPTTADIREPYGVTSWIFVKNIDPVIELILLGVDEL
jgi:hypothetical protein